MSKRLHVEEIHESVYLDKKGFMVFTSPMITINLCDVTAAHIPTCKIKIPAYVLPLIRNQKIEISLNTNDNIYINTNKAEIIDELIIMKNLIYKLTYHDKDKPKTLQELCLQYIDIDNEFNKLNKDSPEYYLNNLTRDLARVIYYSKRF
jgi:hypothetical protein